MSTNTTNTGRVFSDEAIDVLSAIISDCNFVSQQGAMILDTIGADVDSVHIAETAAILFTLYTTTILKVDNPDFDIEKFVMSTEITKGHADRTILDDILERVNEKLQTLAETGITEVRDVFRRVDEPGFDQSEQV